jgi:hypothetical protein
VWGGILVRRLAILWVLNVARATLLAQVVRKLCSQGHPEEHVSAPKDLRIETTYARPYALATNNYSLTTTC